MTVAANALTTLDTVKGHIQSRRRRNVECLSIYHNETGVTSATVTVTSTTVVLTTNLGATTLTIATYTTTTLLVAAINALANWIAIPRGPGAANPNALLQVPATSVMGLDDELYLMMEPDWHFEQLIDAVSQEILTYIDRELLAADTTEYLTGGDQTYNLAMYPINSVARVSRERLDVATLSFTTTTATRASVQVTSTALTTVSVIAGVATTTSYTLATYATLALLKVAVELTPGWSLTITSSYTSYPAGDLALMPPTEALATVGASLYVWDGSPPFEYEASGGIIHFPTPLPRGVNAAMVIYNGGYAAIPADIAMMAVELIGRCWDAMGRDTGLQSERLDTYAWVAKRELMSDSAMLNRLSAYSDPM